METLYVAKPGGQNRHVATDILHQSRVTFFGHIPRPTSLPFKRLGLRRQSHGHDDHNNSRSLLYSGPGLQESGMITPDDRFALYGVTLHVGSLSNNCDSVILRGARGPSSDLLITSFC